MDKKINAEDYNLPKRTQLISLSEGCIGIVKKRKSRIIMKDGRQIVEIALKIRNVEAALSIALIISGPICSKTRKLLQDNKIEVIEE